MTTDAKTIDKKLQYGINGEAAKILALSFGKIAIYEYLKGEEILPPEQRKVIKKAKFAYSPLGKVFENQRKANEERGKNK